MRLFAIGDLHLALDERIDKPMDVFGPAWANHAEKLEENWRCTVSDTDTVLIVGDISWGLKPEEAAADLLFVHNLPGKKILIKGNHDLWWHGITKMNELYDDMYFLQNRAKATDTAIIAGSRGWILPQAGEGFTEQDEKVFRRECLRLESSLQEAAALAEETGKPIIGMMHYPPAENDGKATEFTDLFAKYGTKAVYYGHLHGPEVFPKGFQGVKDGVEYHLVSLDYVDATPVAVPLQ